MNISIIKDMYDTHAYKLIELEKDIWNEDAQDRARSIRNEFLDNLESLGISFCGYEGSIFFVCYRDGRIETI